MRLSQANKRSKILLLAPALGIALVFAACASDTSNPASIPIGEPVSAQITGSEVPQKVVNQQLISTAVSDAKNTIGKSISFHKAIKTNSGDVFYVFLIDRVDDNFLVYELNKSNTKFTKKFYYFSLRM